MYAIITELETDIAIRIHQIRADAVEACGKDPSPLLWPLHLSWQGADTYPLHEAQDRIRMISKTFAPVTTHVDGVGVFTGPEPILYLSVTRTPELSALNATLWEALTPLAENPNINYSPDTWVPHITLVYGSSGSADILACLLSKLITTPLHLEISLDHLLLGFYRGEEHGSEFRLPLSGLKGTT